jgi:hypothetical protein
MHGDSFGERVCRSASAIVDHELRTVWGGERRRLDPIARCDRQQGVSTGFVCKVCPDVHCGSVSIRPTRCLRRIRASPSGALAAIDERMCVL